MSIEDRKTLNITTDSDVSEAQLKSLVKGFEDSADDLASDENYALPAGDHECGVRIDSSQAVGEYNIDAIELGTAQSIMEFDEWAERNERAKSDGAFLDMPDEVVSTWSANAQVTFYKAHAAHLLNVSKPLGVYLTENHADRISEDAPTMYDVALLILKEHDEVAKRSAALVDKLDATITEQK